MTLPTLSSARGLRALQVAALMLMVANNVQWLVLGLVERPKPGRWGDDFEAKIVGRWIDGMTHLCCGLFLSLLVALVLVVFFWSVQRAAHALGGPAPQSRFLPSLFACTVVSMIGVPILIFRTARVVALALDDSGIRSRGLVVAWAVGLAPLVVGVYGRVLLSSVDGAAAFWMVPFATVLLSGIATQVVVGPLIEALRARAHLDGVDANGSPAAIRSL